MVRRGIMNNVSSRWGPAAGGKQDIAMSETRLVVGPIDSRETFKDKAYAALRNVIMSSDIYRSRTGVREMPKSCASWRSSSRMSARDR